MLCSWVFQFAELQCRDGLDDLPLSFDNFRMNTGYGRYGAAYSMVAFSCFIDKLLCI
jgi:hypothetical protein